jgi:hypothetical protein
LIRVMAQNKNFVLHCNEIKLIAHKHRWLPPNC